MVTPREIQSPESPSRVFTRSQPVREEPERPGLPSQIQSVDLLLSYSPEQLEELYARGVCPAISGLDGEGKGRMLAVVGPGSRFPVAGLLRRLAGGRYFPWKGKNFSPLSSDAGEGINRTLSNRWPLELFRFETAIDVSLYDGQPAFVLDYDLPGNPGFIRRIRDEIRQISEEVFLGQAWLRTDVHHFVLYFALELP